MQWRSLLLKRKKMKLLTNQQKSYENVKPCYLCEETFEDKYAKDI